MRTVLVVDDVQFVRLALKRLLRERGYEVIEAEDGKRAIVQYECHAPDAVLLDITMPEKNGLEVLREIRQKDPEARIVMLTALGQESMVIKAIEAGAKDFVVKPFRQERVFEALAKALR